MRRLVSSLTLGLALLCASVAWSAFSTRSTFLDSRRSERIADALVADPVVRDAAAKGLSEALQKAIPPGIPIPRSEVDAATRKALEDPRALAALKTAVVDAHRRLIGDEEGPVTLDARPIAEAGRDALIAARPELATALPGVPDASISLPTESLPRLGKLRGPLGLAVRLGSLAAVALLAASFAMAKDRSRVLLRLGRWAVGVGVWWAVIGYGLPRLAAELGDPRLAVLGSLGKAVSAPLVAPAVGLLVVGAGAMFAARLWRLAGVPKPSGPAAPPPGGRAYPEPPARSPYPEAPARPVPADRVPYGQPPRRPVPARKGDGWLA